DDVELDYLFLDGSHFRYHANAAAEPVLAAWASTPAASSGRCAGNGFSIHPMMSVRRQKSVRLPTSR
ncbi:MAG TPA: hypothetical protein VE197_07285, partial [Mycobacterium sp.]|nr:hypothetical protein [Mycobacterium sp.]